jgi:Na+-driven multidrug efflux pump
MLEGTSALRISHGLRLSLHRSYAWGYLSLLLLVLGAPFTESFTSGTLPTVYHPLPSCSNHRRSLSFAYWDLSSTSATTAIVSRRSTLALQEKSNPDAEFHNDKNKDINNEEKATDNELFLHNVTSATTTLKAPLKDSFDSGGTIASSSTATTSTRTVRSSHDIIDGVRSNVPSYRTLIAFAATTILIWLSEPLLSLVDTTVVGMTQPNARVQLASLGPATTLVDSLLYLTYFLAISTTNLISQGLAVKNYRQLQRTTSHVLGVATSLGAFCTLFVYVFGKRVLVNMAGSSGTPELLFFASRYAMIRATVAVSSVVGMTAQAFCLASLDTVTPAVAVGVSSVVNTVGDLLLSRWGVQGAAVATAISNVVATSILLRSVRRQVRKWRELEIMGGQVNGLASEYPHGSKRLESSSSTSTPTSDSIAKTSSSIQLDATEAEKMKKKGTEKENAGVGSISAALPSKKSKKEPRKEIPFISIPDRKSFLAFVSLAGPISFVIMAKVACYSAMTLRCTQFGLVPLAAHNIMMRVFFFYGCFGDSMSQTAQSFMPATLYPKPSTREFQTILKRLLIIACTVGILNSQVSVWILRNLSGYLTRDVDIMMTMKNNAHFLGAALLLHPVILVLEGTVIAARDFGTLVATYMVTLALHFGVLQWYCGSFPAVWRTFFLFQSIRLVNFSSHVWKKQSALRREAAAAAVAAPS